MENWREITKEEIEELSQKVANEIKERREVGIKKYGETFVGIPIQQQREELLDALFYNWADSKERESLINEINSLKNDLFNCIVFLDRYSKSVKTNELKTIIEDFIRELDSKYTLQKFLEERKMENGN